MASSTVAGLPSSQASPGCEVLLGSLSSQSTPVQMPSPSASPMPVQAVGVPAQLQSPSTVSLMVVLSPSSQVSPMYAAKG